MPWVGGSGGSAPPPSGSHAGIQADVTRAIEASGLPTAAPVPGSVEPTVLEEHQAAVEIARMVHAHSQELRQQECGMRGLCAADGSMPAAMLCAMTRLQGCFMLADAALPNAPIVYASPAFLRMSGYCDSGEVLGRDFLHFLQARRALSCTCDAAWICAANGAAKPSSALALSSGRRDPALTRAKFRSCTTR